MMKAHDRQKQLSPAEEIVDAGQFFKLLIPNQIMDWMRRWVTQHGDVARRIRCLQTLVSRQQMAKEACKAVQRLLSVPKMIYLTSVH